MKPKINKLDIIIILILFGGAFLRLYHLERPVLWQDEAETVFHTKNVLEKGLPIGEYKNVPFHENAFLIKSNDEMYEYKPTNYLNKPYVTIKGWFTYYFLAVFLFIQESTFFLRLPFALCGILSLVMIFKLANLMFDKKVATWSLFFSAFNPYLIYYERQIRYYSLELFFVLTTLYFFTKAFQQKKLKDYILGTIFLSLLFHTHIIACLSITLLVVFIALQRKVRYSKGISYSLALFMILTLPWVIFVRLWEEVLIHVPAWTFLIEKKSVFVIKPLLNIQQSLIPLLLLSLLFLVISLVRHAKKGMFFSWAKDSSSILLAWLVIVLFVSTATPVKSFERRIFLILIPLFSILLAKLVNFMMPIRYAKYVIVPLIIFLTFTPLKSPLIENLRKDFEPYGMNNIIQGDLESDAGWVKDITVFFDEKRISKEDLVLTTKEQLPLLYYLNNKVQLIWAVKKKFIDDYKENLWIIENEDDLKKLCEEYSWYTKDYDRCKNFNYIEKIKNCKKYSLKNNINIYYCEKKSNKQ